MEFEEDEKEENYMPQLIDLSGRRFGRLTVIKRAESNRKEVYWVCQCDCGNIKTVRGSLLTTKNKKRRVRSCTCLLKELASARQGILTEKATEANKPFLEFEKGTNIRIISSKKLPKNNKSGVKGVCFDSSRGQWIASLKLKRKVVFRERFRKFDDAVKARKKAEEKYFKPIIENAKNTGLF